MIARDKATGQVLGQVIGDDPPPVWGKVKILTSKGVVTLPVTSVTIEPTR